MKGFFKTKESAVPCALSMAFGIITAPLHLLAYVMLYAYAFYSYYPGSPVKATVYVIVDIVLYSLIGILIIAGIILGIISIKQQRPKKGMAVAGIIICSSMAIAPLLQYGSLYLVSMRPFD